MKMNALLKFLAVLTLSTFSWVAQAAEPALLSQFVEGRNIEQTTEVLKQAIASHNYVFVRQQSIDSRLVPQEWEAKSVRIIYFCNFSLMNNALSRSNLTTQIMPCRITLIEGEKGTNLVAVNPAWVSEQWNAPELHSGCQHLKQDYLTILEETAI